MSRKFTADTDIAFPSFQAIDGADIVETSAGYITSRRSVGTGHDPTGPQRDSMDLFRQTEIVLHQSTLQVSGKTRKKQKARLTLFVVYESHTINLPSCEAETKFLGISKVNLPVLREILILTMKKY